MEYEKSMSESTHFVVHLPENPQLGHAASAVATLGRRWSGGEQGWMGFGSMRALMGYQVSPFMRRCPGHNYDMELCT